MAPPHTSMDAHQYHQQQQQQQQHLHQQYVQKNYSPAPFFAGAGMHKGGEFGPAAPGLSSMPMHAPGLWLKDGMPARSSVRLSQFLPSRSQVKIIALVLMWYISSSLTNNLGKLILTEFNYPVTLTVFQFGFVALYAPLYVKAHRAITTGEPYNIRPMSRAVLRVVVPLALFNIAGHVFSSYAISHASVSFVHTVKALSPLFTVGLSWLALGATYPTSVYVSLGPLVMGVILACWSEVSYSATGFVCALASSLIFVVQNIFSKKVFVDGALDELNLLLHSSLVAFVVMLPAWLYTEGAVIIFGDQIIDPYIVFLFFLNGVTHFAQNIFAFTMMTLVTPVSYAVASLLKRVFVIGAAIVWFATPITAQNFLGLLLTFGGLYLYNRAKGGSGGGKAHGSAALPRYSHDTGIIMSPSESLIGGR